MRVLSVPTNRDRLGDADILLSAAMPSSFGLLSSEGVSAEFGTSEVLVSACRGLDLVASAVSGRSVPAGAAFLGDEMNVAVACGP